MKKIIALAVLLNASTAFAFFADDAASNAAGMGQGRADVQGNGNAEGEANFSMSFTARGKTKGDFAGNGDFNSNVNGYSEQRDVYRPPYYGTRNYNFSAEK